MTPSSDSDVQSLSTSDRIEALVWAVIGKAPADLKEQIKQLASPQALHVIEGVTILWGLSHWVGVGEVFDALVLATGVVALGEDAIRAGKLAMNGFLEGRAAGTMQEFDKAADDIALAISIVGIDMIATLLFRWKRPHVANPNVGNFPRAPEVADGGWVYKPKVQKYPFPPDRTWSNSLGVTDIWGDIRINTRKTLDEQQLALFHEQMHRILRPKIDILRRMRGKWTAASYKYSYLRRYVEEALCQTSALIRQKGLGFNNIVEGLRFPFVRNYNISVSRLLQEVGELYVGPIKVENEIYYLSLQPATASGDQTYLDAFDARRAQMSSRR